jgi:hypothetical protein
MDGGDQVCHLNLEDTTSGESIIRLKEVDAGTNPSDETGREINELLLDRQHCIPTCLTSRDINVRDQTRVIHIDAKLSYKTRSVNLTSEESQVGKEESHVAAPSGRDDEALELAKVAGSCVSTGTRGHDDGNVSFLTKGGIDRNYFDISDWGGKLSKLFKG